MAGLTRPIRWGLIGCGDVCEKKSGPAYQQVSAFNLYGVSARSPGKAKDYAARHNVPHHFESALQLIHDPNIDAIYIATPPDSHLELALQVANANKACCIEKPMALNFSQCKKILAAFESHNLALFVAYYRRSLPGFIALKEALRKDKIGRVRQISWHYSRPPSQQDLSKSQNWRTDKNIALGGYFEDIASHGLNAMTFFVGSAINAHGFCCNQQQLYTAHDAIVANLEFNDGIIGSASWNFGSFVYQDKMQIIGEKGVIDLAVFGDTPATIRTSEENLAVSMSTPDPIQGPFVKAMADHLEGIQIHPSQGESAAHTNWIMDRILGVI